jgi:hypothetical protein
MLPKYLLPLLVRAEARESLSLSNIGLEHHHLDQSPVSAGQGPMPLKDMLTRTVVFHPRLQGICECNRSPINGAHRGVVKGP